MSFGSALIYSLLGLCVVFFALVFLMLIIKLMTAVSDKREKLPALSAEFGCKSSLTADDGMDGIQRGDILFLTWHSNQRWAQHGAYVLNVSGSNISVVEGNMDGGLVITNTYSTRSGLMLGYARPDY